MNIKVYENLFTKVIDQGVERQFEMTFFDGLGQIKTISDSLDMMVLARQEGVHFSTKEVGKKVYVVLRPMTPDEVLRRDMGQPKQNLINYARVVTGHPKSKEDADKLADLLTEEHEEELNTLLEGVTFETEVLTILLNYGYAKGLLIG